MTEAEAIEAFSSLGANAVSAFTVYISFTFGYLATAYFVGSKLTLFQSAVVSGLYIFSAGSAGMAQIVYIEGMLEVTAKTPSVLDNLLLWNGLFWVWNMAIIQAVGIFLSLYFMWSVRHPKTE